MRDASIQTKAKRREKADPADSLQIGAPIPGLISTLAVGVGAKVVPGNKRLVIEAMKMPTTVYAPVDGIMKEILARAGDTAESKNLSAGLAAK